MQGCNPGVSWAAVSFKGLTEGGPALKITHVAVGRIQFLVGCWAAWLLTSHISLQEEPPHMAAGFHQTKKGKESQTQVAVFLQLNLISDISSLWHIHRK